MRRPPQHRGAVSPDRRDDDAPDSRVHLDLTVHVTAGEYPNASIGESDAADRQDETATTDDLHAVEPGEHYVTDDDRVAAQLAVGARGDPEPIPLPFDEKTFEYAQGEVLSWLAADEDRRALHVLDPTRALRTATPDVFDDTHAVRAWMRRRRLDRDLSGSLPAGLVLESLEIDVDEEGR